MQKRLSSIRSNWRIARKHFEIGREEGYPLCCVLHFSADCALDRFSGEVRREQIGTQKPVCPVPCGVLHSNDSPYSLPRRVGVIIKFNVLWLLPFLAKKKSREEMNQMRISSVFP